MINPRFSDLKRGHFLCMQLKAIWENTVGGYVKPYTRIPFPFASAFISEHIPRYPAHAA